MMCAVPARALPGDLEATLRRAAELERTAHDMRQWRRTVHANSRLMLAAVNAGWRVTEVA